MKCMQKPFRGEAHEVGAVGVCGLLAGSGQKAHLRQRIWGNASLGVLPCEGQRLRKWRRFGRLWPPPRNGGGLGWGRRGGGVAGGGGGGGARRPGRGGAWAAPPGGGGLVWGGSRPRKGGKPRHSRREQPSGQ